MSASRATTTDVCRAQRLAARFFFLLSRITPNETVSVSRLLASRARNEGCARKLTHANILRCGFHFSYSPTLQLRGFFFSLFSESTTRWIIFLSPPPRWCRFARLPFFSPPFFYTRRSERAARANWNLV